MTISATSPRRGWAVAGMAWNLRRSVHGEPEIVWASDHDCAQSRRTAIDEDPDSFAGAPFFVDDTRRDAGGTAPDSANIPLVEPHQLNTLQRQAFEIVRRRFRTGGDTSPLRMLVLGTAGTGQSWLV